MPTGILNFFRIGIQINEYQSRHIFVFLCDLQYHLVLQRLILQCWVRSTIHGFRFRQEVGCGLSTVAIWVMADGWRKLIVRLRYYD